MIFAFLIITFIGTTISFASDTLTVGPEGNYTNIQDAINAASPGATILVEIGTYNGDLHIDKQLTLKGQNIEYGHPVICGSGNGDVITISADGVRIEGFEIKNSEKYASAIRVESNDNTITGNSVTGCNEGIRMDHSDRNLITDNKLIDNRGDGIYIHNSDDNVISQNDAERNQFGIQGNNLKGNIINRNNFKANTGIDVYLENVTDTMIDSNRVEDNEHASRSGGDGIGMRYGNNITISNNYVGKHYYGIKVYYSSLVTVTNNTAENSGVNIRFDFGTTDSNITHNVVKNGVDNILLGGDSTRILIEYNEVSSGKDGIYLFSSSNNTVQHNNVQGSTYGIRLYKSTDNLITLNYLHENDNDIYPDATGSTVGDNANRANYFGPDKSQTITATPTSIPVTGTPSTPSNPTATPSQNQEPTDIISEIIDLIRDLFS